MGEDFNKKDVEERWVLFVRRALVIYALAMYCLIFYMLGRSVIALLSAIF